MTWIREKQTSRTMDNYLEWLFKLKPKTIPPFYGDRVTSLGMLLMAQKQKKEMKPTVIILCGIPTSGKSTWATKYAKRHPITDSRAFFIVSRDHLRKEMFGKNYKHSLENETKVTNHFNQLIGFMLLVERNLIIDNTHCREKYIDEMLNIFESQGWTVIIKYFDLPLWQAYYRNIKRWIFTGRWIPISVLKNMKKNYDKLNRKKYRRYELSGQS